MPAFPKKIKKNDRIYVIADNKVIGYHKFAGFAYFGHDWQCEVTGNWWPKGKYICRKAESWRHLKVPIETKYHRGFRYHCFENFRKKPVKIQAMQQFVPFKVETKEGVMKGKPGDYLIIGVEGERYPCDKDIFEKTYAKAN